MKQHQRNYLKTLRLKSGLTQQDVAYLLGLKSREKLSSIETRKKLPSIDIIVACNMIYQAEPKDFVPDEFRRIENNVIHRAKSLCQELKKRTRNPDLKRRLRALSRIIDAN